MIVTVTLNPAVDREYIVPAIEFDTVLRATEWRTDVGGKGFNVARMLRSIGAPSLAMGFAGGRSGEFLRDGLESLGIETDFVWVEGVTRTNVSIVSSRQGRYVKANEPGPTISAGARANLKQKILAAVTTGSWWVLAGSLPPGVPADIYRDLIDLIQDAGGQAILDASGEALSASCRAGPFLVKPNVAEAHQLTGLPVETITDITAAGLAIHKIGGSVVVVSRGKDGASLTDGQTAWHATAPLIEERNPIGAGDSMVAGLVWGLSQGYDLGEALRWGVACGAATASLSGTAVGSQELVRSLLPKITVLSNPVTEP